MMQALLLRSVQLRYHSFWNVPHFNYCYIYLLLVDKDDNETLCRVYEMGQTPAADCCHDNTMYSRRPLVDGDLFQD